MNYFLGLDSGGTFMKAVLFDREGNQVARTIVQAQVVNVKPGWVERELDALWHDAKKAIEILLSSTDIAPEQIKGLSISAQGKGAYLLDKAGNNLRNGIMSSDSRSLSIVKAWQKKCIPEKIYPITLQTLWTGHPVSIIRWLKENEPENYANIGSILMAHDYIRYRLTGAIHAELTNISESNFFNSVTSEYDKNLLQVFEIEESWSALATVLKPDQLAGLVTKSVAKETGLVAGTPVYGGLFDVVSTAICSGIDANAQALNYVMGTWSVTSGIATDVTTMGYNFVYGHYTVENQYIIHEASPTSASNYEWFVEYLGLNGEFDHELNQQLVSELPPAVSSLLFVPFLYGSNMGLGIKAGFYGLQSHHTRGHLIQAIWEGILFCHNVHLDRIRMRFPDAKVLRVTGGPATSKVWMQMLADLTGMRVELPNVSETGALGAALMAMVGSGEYPTVLAGLKHIDFSANVIEPSTKHYEMYQAKYRKYLRLVEMFKAFEDENND